MMFNSSVCYKQESVSFYDSIRNGNGSKSDCSCGSRCNWASGCSFSIACSCATGCSSDCNCSCASHDDAGDDANASVSGSNSEKPIFSDRDSCGEAEASLASDAPLYSEHNRQGPLLGFLLDILSHRNRSA